MTDWTSISVTEEQKTILEGHKPEEQAMGRFLVGAVQSPASELPESLVQRLDELDKGSLTATLRFLLGHYLTESNGNGDMQEQLDRIESGVREATNAAQSADKKLEGLGR